MSSWRDGKRTNELVGKAMDLLDHILEWDVVYDIVTPAWPACGLTNNFDYEAYSYT